MHILYVEDDQKLQAQMRQFLQWQHHQVSAFSDVPDALHFLQTHQPDVVLCDYRLEGSVNGLALARQVRQLYPACTIAMISAFTTTANVIEALVSDVDAYIERPITLLDMLDEVYAAVERRRSKQPPPVVPVTRGALALDMAQRQAIWHGEPLNLTPTELAILAQLVSKPHHVVTPVDLWAAVKGVRLDQHTARQLLKPHLAALRAKLTQEGKYPQPIQNVRGQGYRWHLPEDGGTLSPSES